MESQDRATAGLLGVDQTGVLEPRLENVGVCDNPVLTKGDGTYDLDVRVAILGAVDFGAERREGDHSFRKSRFLGTDSATEGDGGKLHIVGSGDVNGCCADSLVLGNESRQLGLLNLEEEMSDLPSGPRHARLRP